MKKIVVLLGIFMCALTAQSFATVAINSTVAVVNVQQVLQQSPKIKALNAKLQTQFKSRQEKLIAQQKALQEEVEKAKKDAVTMDAKDRDALQKKVDGDQADLVKEVGAFQKDLNAEQNKAMQSVLAELNGIISTLAKKGSYSLVLDSQAVVYAAEAADMTKEVAKEFDKK